jgi:anthranilate/para-aminobenzoate synthase component I
MNVFPTQNQFSELCRQASRVPVVSQKPVSPFNPLRFFKGFYGDSPRAFLFESGKGPEATARYTLLGAPNSRFIRVSREAVQICSNGSTHETSGDLNVALKHLEFQNEGPDFDYIPHFWGGWVGYIGYEAARWFEQLPLSKKDDLELPDLYFMQVDRFWLYDHKEEILKYIIAGESGENPDEAYPNYLEEMDQVWLQAQAFLHASPKDDNGFSGKETGKTASFKANLSPDQYMDRVERAKDYITEGDIYQANLAQRFEIEACGDTLDLYYRLQKVNPSPFSGFLKFEDLSICSSSPERLVKRDREILETRPIAGTRPRGKNRDEDTRLSAELLLNEKEKAEHLMLVDLERNDMGRICEFGSVTVTDLMFLEHYSHVTHIVSNIRGHLRPDVGLREILRAIFPGGTITGCPKIRCMEIIDELEPTPRGPYSGSFGYIGFGNYLDLNIIIRSIITRGDKAFFHVGAGIVADSVPEKEFQETLDKAQALFMALFGKEFPS